MRRPSRLWARAAALALVLPALAGCGAGRTTAAARAPQVPVTETLGGTAAAPTTTTGAASGVAAATGTQATATSTVTRDGRSPSLVHLQAVLVRQAAHLGPGVSIAVEDLSRGRMLFTRSLTTPRPPASVEKLYTAASLLWLLGPQARLHTELYGTGGLDRHGTWHGNLYLRGDGDPTFGDGGWNRIYAAGEGPTVSELLNALRARGIRRVDGLLYADPSRFDAMTGGPATRDLPDVGDYGGQLSALVYDHGMTAGGLGPAASAVHEIALAARASRLRIVAARGLARTPAAARLLVRLASPPMSALLSLMLVPSDDLFADLFTKQLGFHFYGHGTLGFGALAIRQSIAAHYRIAPTILDGSGLDRADRSSAAQVLTLLRTMYATPVGDQVRADMAVTGRSGTVAGVGLHTPAAGRCQAKTGTLDEVTNLAGYCAAAGGHTLAFVFLVDGPQNWTSLAAFTPMLGALAGY